VWGVGVGAGAAPPAPRRFGRLYQLEAALYGQVVGAMAVPEAHPVGVVERFDSVEGVLERGRVVPVEGSHLDVGRFAALG